MDYVVVRDFVEPESGNLQRDVCGPFLDDEDASVFCSFCIAKLELKGSYHIEHVQNPLLLVIAGANERIPSFDL